MTSQTSGADSAADPSDYATTSHPASVPHPTNGRAVARGTTADNGSRRLDLALLVIASAQLMVVLDSTIVNVALPHVQRELGFSGSGLEWVVNAYAVTFGGLLLLGGRAGDILGRRRSSSLGCCCSPPRPSSAGSPPASGGCSPRGRSRAWAAR